MKTIIVMEDERALREALIDKLTREGFTTFAAGNGQQGIDLIRQKKPDLAIIDLIMPVKTGETAIYEIRADKDISYIPIYVLSNVSDVDRYSKGIMEHIQAFDVKSDIRIDQIVENVKKLTNGV